jgi:hypothetical protein
MVKRGFFVVMVNQIHLNGSFSPLCIKSAKVMHFTTEAELFVLQTSGQYVEQVKAASSSKK